MAAGFTGFNNVASGAIVYTVPAGKRLVIESATILCGVPTVEKAYRAQISITNNGGQLSHHLAPIFTGLDANPIFATYIVNWSGKLYADAGPVQMGVFKSGTTGGSNTCHYTISGYLVTVP